MFFSLAEQNRTMTLTRFAFASVVYHRYEQSFRSHLGGGPASRPRGTSCEIDIQGTVNSMVRLLSGTIASNSVMIIGEISLRGGRRSGVRDVVFGMSVSWYSMMEFFCHACRMGVRSSATLSALRERRYHA